MLYLVQHFNCISYMLRHANSNDLTQLLRLPMVTSSQKIAKPSYYATIKKCYQPTAT